MWPRVVAGVAAGAVLVVSATGAATGLVLTKIESNVKTVDIAPQFDTGHVSTPIKDDGGSYTAQNILLMGSDTRQGETTNRYGDPDLYSTDQSDTVILLHLPADRSGAVAVSIPRDTWVELPTCVNEGGKTVGGYEAKFNEAYMLGGPACTVKGVEELTGVHIDHFMVINFQGFKDVVNALGGVDICLTKAVNDPKSGLVLPAGNQTVRDEDALAFVRARKTLGDGSDIQRIKRQQQFLSSMIRKATSAGILLNPSALYSLLDVASQSLTTDSGLAGTGALQDFILSVRDMKPEDITFLTAPWKERGDGANVVIDTEAAQPLWDAIKNDTVYAPIAKTSGTGQPRLRVAPSSIEINVLNGTSTAGLASKAAEELQKAGFIVINVGDADASTYTESTIKFAPGSTDASKTLGWAVEGSTTAETASQGNVIDVIIGSNYKGIRPVKIAAGTTTEAARTADEVSCS